MKTLIFILSLIFSIQLSAQSTVVTKTLSVKGNCGDCKERIENAADIKGVKNAKWDEKTHVATIIFDSKKVTMEQIEKAIAKAGYDTEHVKADPASYKALPECCQYSDRKHTK